MPKLKSKEEALRQVTRCADILKKALLEKYGGFENMNQRVVGKGDLRAVLGRHGERFKDVVMSATKKFNIQQFFDSEGEIKIIVLDYKKPLLQVFCVTQNE